MTSEAFRAAEATEAVPCPVCGAETHEVLFEAGDYEYQLPGRFFVSRCRGCGLLFQNPRPPFAEILRYYTESYEPYKAVGSSLMQRIRRRFLVSPRLEKYRKLAARFERPVDFLDVGCATGDLLAELATMPEFRCQGLEPVSHAAQIARERGFEVHCATMEEWDMPDGQFDVVSLNHVIEHVPDPKGLAARICRLLRPDGVLTGETPCVDALERLVFGRYWKIYHLPRHLTFFSKELLIRLLREAGFSRVELHLQPAPTTWQGSVRNYLLAGDFPPFVKERFSGQNVALNLAVAPIVFPCAWLGYASIVHFTAYK